MLFRLVRLLTIDCRPFLQGVCSGVVRGSGRQKIGVVINFISYCCVGIPVGIILMFFVFRESTGESKH